MGNIGLWIVMAVLAAASTIAVLFPLLRARSAAGAVNSVTAERAIYRDQLQELEREVERGLIGGAEAEAARVEIARRLLHTADGSGGAAAAGKTWRRLAVALIVAGPAAAVGAYVYIGSPNMPDNPQAARMAASVDEADLPTLVARVEGHLAENPDDGRGWQVIAPIYVRMGRYEDAATAFANANRLLGPTAILEANVGEALVWANEGRVVESARAAFRRAVELDPRQVRPRFYLASGLSQDGDDAGAVDAWRALLADAPADAAWAEDARAALAAAQARLGGEEPGVGPSAAEVSAAQELAPEDREAMILGMVQGLAARLEEEPNDAQGWSRLIRSYVVLNQRGEAVSALEKARGALAVDSEGRQLVEDVAREFGLETEVEQSQ